MNFGVKFQYERRDQNTERQDEEDSYFMRNMINGYAATNPQGGFTYYIPEGGRMEESHARWSYMNLRAQFDYQTSINDKHEITALLGGEIREDKYRKTRSERYGYNEQKLVYKQVDWDVLNEVLIGHLSNIRVLFKNKNNYTSVTHTTVMSLPISMQVIHTIHAMPSMVVSV